MAPEDDRAPYTDMFQARTAKDQTVTLDKREAKSDPVPPDRLTNSLRRKRKSRSQTVCKPCRARKVRCDHGTPCRTCVERCHSELCQYPSDHDVQRSRSVSQRKDSAQWMPSKEEWQALQASVTSVDRSLQEIREDSDRRRNGSGGNRNNQWTASLRSMVTTGLSTSAVAMEQAKAGREKQLRAVGIAAEFGINDDTLDVESIRKGITYFYSSTERIFHVFSKEQIKLSWRDVLVASSPEAKQIGICCLAAVAAVGSLYAHDDGESRGKNRQALYDLVKRYYEDVIETKPLDAIKICALMAMYNIISKTTVALAYIEAGLGICRKLATDTRSSHSLDSIRWIDYRKTRRTLLFFSSWLASALGYVSGNDILMREGAILELHEEKSHDMDEIIQTEMTKIGLMKADILRMDFTLKQSTPLGVHAIIRDHEDWYSKLPDQISVANICLEELGVSLRRTICHVHLLYLGTVMLLYRRVVSHMVCSCGWEQKLWELVSLGSQVETISGIFEKGFESAKLSARILALLLADDGVFRRCWLVISEAYMSCTVILHSVVQKQLHEFPTRDWMDDLAQAEQCLEVLKFCAAEDIVAQGHYESLMAAYQIITGENSASRADASPQLAAASDRLSKPMALLHYILSMPSTTEHSRMLASQNLLKMVCSPFQTTH